MTNSKNISAISNFVDNFPLQDILETAEIVVKYIPSPINLPVDIIIKVIKVLLKLQPAAGKAIKAGASIVQNCEEYNLCKDNTTKQSYTTLFENLVELAATDGVLSDDEHAFLKKKAVLYGISEDEFELIIMNRFNK